VSSLFLIWIEQVAGILAELVGHDNRFVAFPTRSPYNA